MHAPPVRSRIGLTSVAAVSFEIVFASGHLFSIAASYAPRRGLGCGVRGEGAALPYAG
jgi:hypothetical protein